MIWQIIIFLFTSIPSAIALEASFVQLEWFMNQPLLRLVLATSTGLFTGLVATSQAPTLEAMVKSIKSQTYTLSKGIREQHEIELEARRQAQSEIKKIREDRKLQIEKRRNTLIDNAINNKKEINSKLFESLDTVISITISIMNFAITHATAYDLLTMRSEAVPSELFLLIGIIWSIMIYFSFTAFSYYYSGKKIIAKSLYISSIGGPIAIGMLGAYENGTSLLSSIFAFLGYSMGGLIFMCYGVGFLFIIAILVASITGIKDKKISLYQSTLVSFGCYIILFVIFVFDAWRILIAL